MLENRGVAFEYREYTQDPLEPAEIRRVLDLLGVGARQLLRKNDRAYRELCLDGSESEDELVELMSRHPTLLQRPIGVVDNRAAVGRPPEELLELLSQVSS